MALNPQFSNVTVNAEADALSLLLDNGWIRVYDGAQPVDADTAIGAQVLLAELRFAADAFPPAVAGVLTSNAIVSDASANASGTATWCRCFKADGTTAVMDGTVGTLDANIIINSTAIVAATLVSSPGVSITIPKGGAVLAPSEEV